MKMFGKFVSTILHIILAPVYLVIFLIVIIIWFIFTITGIGPCLQYLFTRWDQRTLNPKKFLQQFPNDVRMISIPAGEPSVPSNYPPICIPNGLGATAVLISQMQEALVAQGFRVLSFDRLGVGLSDPNEAKHDPTAMDIVKEMDYVMESIAPNQQWILLGPSMGSIIAQCYISMFPQKVVGFLNMDGLPYPFFKHRSSFMWAAFIYRVYASIIWTGILRPFIGLALKSSEKMFQCQKFPLSIVIAQMNQSRFYGNVAKEMWSMMDCCEMAEVAWGKQSVVRIANEQLQALIRAPPTISIEFDDISGVRMISTFRSESELGKTWATPTEVQSAVEYLVGEETAEAADSENPLQIVENSSGKDKKVVTNVELIHHSILGEAWRGLVVRVMSARCHDFGNAVANSFYNQEMRDYAAAEHAIHALLAKDGARTVYPKITHTVMFSKTDDIVRNIVEIAHILSIGTLSDIDHGQNVQDEVLNENSAHRENLRLRNYPGRDKE